MLSSSPLDSPLATMCSSMGGKCPTPSSAALRLVPSLTRWVESASRRLSHALETTSLAMFMASTSGTPLLVRMLKVFA